MVCHKNTAVVFVIQNIPYLASALDRKKTEATGSPAKIKVKRGVPIDLQIF